MPVRPTAGLCLIQDFEATLDLYYNLPRWSHGGAPIKKTLRRLESDRVVHKRN
jgi:hypothetical protein